MINSEESNLSVRAEAFLLYLLLLVFILAFFFMNEMLIDRAVWAVEDKETAAKIEEERILSSFESPDEIIKPNSNSSPNLRPNSYPSEYDFATTFQA